MDQTQQAIDLTALYDLAFNNRGSWAGPVFWYNYQDFVTASGTGADGLPQCTTGDDPTFSSPLCQGLEFRGSTGVGVTKLSWAAYQASPLLPEVPVANNLTASGTSQSTAAALPAQINDVTSVAAGTGVVLPPAGAGQQNIVCNDGANALLIYPAGSAAIGGNVASAPVGESAGQCITFEALSTTAWRITAGNPASTLAAGYYISPSGSDSSGAGTFGAPWATFGKCQTAMQAGSQKICYARGGTYALPSGGLALTTADNGETFQYYPPDGVNSPILTTGSVAASTPAINSSCVGCIINGVRLNVSGNVGSYIAVAFGSANYTQFTNNIIDGQNTTSHLYLVTFNVGTSTGVVFSGNTIQNAGIFTGGQAYGTGVYFSNEVTNSIFKNNTFQCLGAFGLDGRSGGASGVVFSNNKTINIGEVGGAASNGAPCSTATGGTGTGMEVTSMGLNLYAGNSDVNAQGYALAVTATNGVTTTPAFISDNNYDNNSDPPILVQFNSYTVVRRNTIISPGSIGMNLGLEQDTCSLRTGRSDHLLVTNNTITAPNYEGIYLSGTQNSSFFGNAITGSGSVVSTGCTSGSDTSTPHFAAGFTAGNYANGVNGAGTNGGSTGNTIEDNTITSNTAATKYGIYFDTNQQPNTASHNILYPFGSSGTAALQSVSGGITNTDNQTTLGGSVTAAPALANAGPAQIAAGGQTITLDGSASANFPSGTTTGVTYAWSCLTNCTGLTITSATSAMTTVTGVPSNATLAGSAEILIFQLVATNANGSTTDEVAVGLDPSLGASSGGGEAELAAVAPELAAGAMDFVLK